MITIGMAGHIDHGKSAVVRALTRMNPDRLPEEQRRGMTIDVGFSWMILGNGERVAIIDVPGHRDYMKNVIAGLWGIDAALLVVAADDGWMPQTEEHFQILRFFDVRHAVVAITKVDMVMDSEWLDLVEEDVRRRIGNSHLAGSAVVRVDSLGGANIPLLKEQIEKLVPKISRKHDIGKPRVPVDRVFTIKGIGTVATGTLIDGSLSRDQQVFVPPVNGSRRVRGLETFKRAVERASPGSRVAVNLVGVEKGDIRRGDTLFGGSDPLDGIRAFEACVELVPGLGGPLTGNQEVMIHLGTREILGRVRLLGGKTLRPGEKGFGRFALREAVYARIGDRFIMRRPSPSETIGGGVVLDISANRYRVREEEKVTHLEMRVDLDLERLILSELARSEYVKTEGLLAAALYSSSAIDESVKALIREDRLVAAGAWIIGVERWKRLGEKALAILSAHHETYPLEEGMARAAFRSRLGLPEGALNGLLSFLKDAGEITVKGDVIALSFHSPALSRRQEAMASKIEDLFKRDPLNPPTKNELAASVPGCEPVIQFMCRRKVLLALQEGVLLERDQYAVIKARIVEFLGREGTISIQQVRAFSGLSRKYILPLLSQLDREGVTLKEGDLRVLAAPGVTSV